MGVAARYWAFLSYSHADRRVAKRLHRALENYRIPQRLVGGSGPQGTIPRRVAPIFRDRDELDASGRIGTAVEAALAGSRALIVLCSPAAAQSAWVDAEIAAFERNHPERPVLCVLLAGEPSAAHTPGATARPCLPPTLRPRFGSGAGIADTAPIAVDLRAHGDGWRRGIQKLVAALAGVALDQLVQRDAHRRHLRMAWLSAALAAIAFTLGAMALLAYRARDEARTQRAQAEGLVGFMLVDLRKKLEPVGRLDVLDAVGARALRYYDAQDPRALDGKALGGRARALRLIGEVRDLRGDIPGARAAFQRASDTTALLLQRAPDDPARIFDHAQSVFWAGYLDWQYGDIAAAERAFFQYQQLATRLVKRDPANMDWLAELGNAYSNLGTLLLEQGRAREALTQFEMSRRNDARRVADQPDDPARRLDLAQDLSWLASAYAADLRFGDALQARRAEIALYAPMLRRDPRDAVVLGRMMIARRFLAELHLDRGQIEAAVAEAGASSRMAETQLRLEPANTDWMQAAAKARLMQAELSGIRGQWRPGLASVERARSLLAELLQRDPGVWSWRVELQETLAWTESDLLRRAGGQAAALRVARASQARLLALSRERGSAIRVQRWLAIATARRARLLADQGDAPGAGQAWAEVAALLAARADNLDAEALLALSDALAATGAGARARQLRQRLLASGYRHPEFTGVARVADAGRSRD